MAAPAFMPGDQVFYVARGARIIEVTVVKVEKRVTLADALTYRYYLSTGNYCHGGTITRTRAEAETKALKLRNWYERKQKHYASLAEEARNQTT